MTFFIDTSILIDFLRKKVDPATELFLDNIVYEDIGSISTITITELAVGAYYLGSNKIIENTLKLISLFHIVDLDSYIALEAGKIQARLKKEGNEIELNDCIIAASAMSQKMDTIITRNKKHYERIKGIKALTPEEIQKKKN